MSEKLKPFRLVFKGDPEQFEEEVNERIAEGYGVRLFAENKNGFYAFMLKSSRKSTSIQKLEAAISKLDKEVFGTS